MDAKKKHKEEVTKQIGERIRRVRKEKQITQEELSERVSEQMNANTISGIELGKGDPKISTIYAIARALKVSLVELVDVNNPKIGLSETEAQQQEIVFGLLKRLNEKDRERAIRILSAINK